ncbi:Rhamnan synthesis protein F [Actinomyces bovis]|uniref:Rhamnan synthesis protein F n=1 Tax=Actinomyces bovis TaxID=1658 RepID=A0ABY1VNM2_9ACTO|nr:rhamnan synthesis F family protein [Actinomyces bovis]SPT53297.1 Rhamnan synthesis protein F [Actinomyces bovis]VEG52608.1 Rhamnan synthesis protein F [Actinomyces israelii]
MILGDSPKRLGIFFFYDGDGVVDSYVETMLADMVKNLTELTVVVNGLLTANSYRKLAAFTDKIIVRENVGLDVWAYKTAMESYGWERLSEFDEVVLFNFTIMGPVYPFAEMYTEMGRRDVDFWGITWFHQADLDPFGTLPEGYIPRHLQSHFHAYRRSLVTSHAFQEYWDNMPMINGYEYSVGMHEAPFTQRFERLGFVSDVYVNTEDLEGFTYQPILFAPRKLIEEKRCPVFKRRSFFHSYGDLVAQSAGNATVDLYEYLRDHTSFDTNLIWDNVTRSVNMADAVKNLQLTYVLPTETVSRPPQSQKVALVAHLYYMDLLESTLGYIRSMPEGCDVFLTVGSAEKARLVKQACDELPYHVEVRLIENRGRDVSALLVGVKDVIMDYDLVCFVHDKKVTQLDMQSKGEGFALKCFENLLPTPAFVENVIAKFDQEPRLGMLMPTPPNHGDYFPVYTAAWGPNFSLTASLLKELGVQVPLDSSKEPIAPLGTMFWFRPKALEKLFDYDWQWDHFPPEPNNNDGTLLHAIERAYGYVAQGAGYFCAWLFSDRFARIELTSLAFYMREYTGEVHRRLEWAGPQRDMITRMGERLGEVSAKRELVRGLKRVVKRRVPARLHPPLQSLYGTVRKAVR